MCKDWKLTRGGGKKTVYVHPEQGWGGQRLSLTKDTINYQP